MKRGTTIFLRIAVIMIGLPILGICIFWLPWIGNRLAEMKPEFAYLEYPFLIGLYATALAYFIALYQTIKLLGYIDKNNAFSELSIEALKKIKFCAFAISLLYAIGMPFLIGIAQEDDAPGLAALGLVIGFAAFAIALFAAVLQKLLQEAIAIKSENELTI